MFSKIWFIFWALIALFVVAPILNTVVRLWTDEGGVLDATFNASDPQSWNASGSILTENQTTHIGLTPFEDAFTQFYTIVIVIFLVIMIIWVLSMGRSKGGE